ncbi:hypothetical protein BH09MYX1_BH09MYX1_53520 [soil metagenome]
MNRKQAHFAAILGLGVTSALFVAAVTHAQSIGQEEAQKRFQEGKTLFDQRQFAEARVKFVQACAVVQTANCPKNIALTEFELAMWVEAATHFQQWFDDPRTKSDAVRPELERVFNDTKLKVGQLDFDVDSGARVSVDGKLVGTSPISAPLFLVSGDHVIQATWVGSTKTAKVTLFNGKASKVELHQDVPRGDAGAAGAPPPSGSASVAPPPSASASVAPPPSASATVAPPPSASAAVAPPPSATVPQIPEEPPKSKGPAIAVGGILTAGGILGLIGFGAFASGSNSSKEEADAYTNTGVCVNPEDARCLDYKSKRDSQGTQHTLSIISLVSGLIFMAGGVTLIVFAATSKKAAPVRLTPQVGAGFVSLELGGTF